MDWHEARVGYYPHVIPLWRMPPQHSGETMNGERGVEEIAELLRQRLLSGLYLGSLGAGARLPNARTSSRLRATV